MSFIKENNLTNGIKIPLEKRWSTKTIKNNMKGKNMKKLNSNHLKLIAIIAMTIDHIADLIFPGMPNNIWSNILHIIGRLTAPIMFFFICEGFYYTKNLKKYVTRLFLFALISHFAYCFAFGINFIPFINGEIFNQTSIMWSLAWAVVALYVVYGDTKLKQWQKTVLLLIICAITFCADFSSIAVMCIVAMYGKRGNIKKQVLSMEVWLGIYALISFIFVNKTYAIIILFSILVYPILKMYDGSRGKLKWMKWLFYIYYPLHLAIIGLLRILMYGNVPLLF